MNSVQLTRQYDLIPIEKLGENITIIGAGAIGSFVTLALAKMGFGNLTVYDFDKIEEENLNSQFYPVDTVGFPKTGALYHVIKEFSDFEITEKDERYEGGNLIGIIISAVDNMRTRKLIWENAKTSPLTKFVIDPRMAIETGLIYVMNPHSKDDIEAYEKTLYSDEEAEFDRCTNKSVMYTPLIIAGLVAKAVKDIVMGEKYMRTALLGIKDNEYHLS